MQAPQFVLGLGSGFVGQASFLVMIVSWSLAGTQSCSAQRMLLVPDWTGSGVGTGRPDWMAFQDKGRVRAIAAAEGGPTG